MFSDDNQGDEYRRKGNYAVDYGKGCHKLQFVQQVGKCYTYQPAANQPGSNRQISMPMDFLPDSSLFGQWRVIVSDDGQA